MSIREIIGNTTATPSPQVDWNQSDSTKPDYIKNKPDVSGEWHHIITTEEDLLNNLHTYTGNILVKGINGVSMMYAFSQDLNEGARLLKFVDTTLNEVYLVGNKNCTIEGLRICSSGTSTSNTINNFGEVKDCKCDVDYLESLHIINCNHISNSLFERAVNCNYIDNCSVRTGGGREDVLLENCKYICGIVVEADSNNPVETEAIFKGCSYLSNISVAGNLSNVEVIYDNCAFVDAQTCAQFVGDGDAGKVQVLTRDGSFRAINPAEEGGGGSGEDGVGIESIVQTTTSTESGGKNVITATLTDGAKSTFTVYNGAKGNDGADGVNGTNGYTPIRGTDYWTEADKAEIKSYVDAAILNGEW